MLRGAEYSSFYGKPPGDNSTNAAFLPLIFLFTARQTQADRSIGAGGHGLRVEGGLWRVV
jgi:hypothetical protein